MSHRQHKVFSTHSRSHCYYSLSHKRYSHSYKNTLFFDFPSSAQHFLFFFHIKEWNKVTHTIRDLLLVFSYIIPVVLNRINKYCMLYCIYCTFIYTKMVSRTYIKMYIKKTKKKKFNGIILLMFKKLMGMKQW